MNEDEIKGLENKLVLAYCEHNGWDAGKGNEDYDNAVRDAKWFLDWVAREIAEHHAALLEQAKAEGKREEARDIYDWYHDKTKQHDEADWQAIKEGK